MTEVETTVVILLELTKNITQLTQEAMDSDPVISTIPKPKLLEILNSLVTNVIIYIILSKLLALVLIVIIFQGKLDLFQSGTHTSHTYYKLRKAPTTTEEMAATKQELLLQIIGEVGSKGIW